MNFCVYSARAHAGIDRDAVTKTRGEPNFPPPPPPTEGRGSGRRLDGKVAKEFCCLLYLLFSLFCRRLFARNAELISAMEWLSPNLYFRGQAVKKALHDVGERFPLTDVERSDWEETMDKRIRRTSALKTLMGNNMQYNNMKYTLRF